MGKWKFQLCFSVFIDNPKDPCFAHEVSSKDYYLLDIPLSEWKLGWDMEHNLSLSEDSEYRLRASLSVSHVQPPTKPVTLKRQMFHASCVASNLQNKITFYCYDFWTICYPLKSCSSIFSPSRPRNSLKAGVSSLFPNNSSSDVWKKETPSTEKHGLETKRLHIFLITSDGVMHDNLENMNLQQYITHLSKLLVDNTEFESVVHLMFIISHY